MRQGRRSGGVEGTGRVALAAVLAATGSACFDGANALGLPCRTDDDCGLGQRCEQGFCGGPPSSTSAPGGSSSSSGDPGATNSSGVLDSSSGSSSGGPGPFCGNGMVDDDEECDPGLAETPECDGDCTFAVCGDTHVNSMAGERCDDGNDLDVDDCTTQCQRTLFFDDMEDDMLSMSKWATEIPSYNYDGTDYALTPEHAWTQGLPGMPSVGVWHSGPYSDGPGTTRLLTVPIAFPADLDANFHFELRFTHTVRFDGNGVIDTECGGMSHSDGGIVWLRGRSGRPDRPLGPVPGDGFMLTDPGNCVGTNGADPNPLFVLPGAMTPPVYSGAVTVQEEVHLRIEDVAGTSQQIMFEVGYDCNNCWDNANLAGAPAPGWIIDDVVIAPFQ